MKPGSWGFLGSDVFSFVNPGSWGFVGSEILVRGLYMKCYELVVIRALMDHVPTVARRKHAY